MEATIARHGATGTHRATGDTGWMEKDQGGKKTEKYRGKIGKLRGNKEKIMRRIREEWRMETLRHTEAPRPAAVPPSQPLRASSGRAVPRPTCPGTSRLRLTLLILFSAMTVWGSKSECFLPSLSGPRWWCWCCWWCPHADHYTVARHSPHIKIPRCSGEKSLFHTFPDQSHNSQ